MYVYINWYKTYSNGSFEISAWDKIFPELFIPMKSVTDVLYLIMKIIIDNKYKCICKKC